MIRYASRTGTRRNLAVLRREGWRLMISATGVHRTEGFPYAIDNGAWTAHQSGEHFNRQAFLKVVGAFGEGADFVVVPDIVAGGADSLSFSQQWLPQLLTMPHRALYLAVQDGMTPSSILPTIRSSRSIRGIFVGGSSEWKDSTIPSWGQFGYSQDLAVHVGRVNTKRRLSLCAASAIASIDGSGPSRFAIHAEKKMSAWARQEALQLFNMIGGTSWRLSAS